MTMPDRLNYGSTGTEERESLSLANDVLSLAVAHTTSQNFKANDFLWMETVQEGQRMLNESSPELLAEIDFQNVGGERIWSDRVDQILVSWRRSGIASVLGPYYKKMHIDEDSKKQIIEGNGMVLASNADAIQTLAALLDDRLGIDK